MKTQTSTNRSVERWLSLGAWERIPERIVEQTVDIAASAILVPPITEEDIAEVVQCISPDRTNSGAASEYASDHGVTTGAGQR